MNRHSFSPCLARAFFLIILSVLVGNVYAAAKLDFSKTFNDSGEPSYIHYQASYQLGNMTHNIEVWRDQNQRLKRLTDNRIETFVFKESKQVEWQMVVLDLTRKIRTDITRTNLYRIGHFTDWFSLSHSLSRPLIAYQLIESTPPEGSEKPFANCRWYQLKMNTSNSRICWSTKVHLPLLITDVKGKTQWRVTALDTRQIDTRIFRIDDAGFVYNDGNDDIKAD